MRAAIVTSIGLALLAGAQAQAQVCQPPRMLVVLDKSSSMTYTVGGQTKWSAARNAVTQITQAYEDSIDFGLMLYPKQPNATTGGQCTPGSVLVPIPTVGAAAAIAAQLQSDPPTGGNYTPTSQSLDVASNYSPLLASTGGRFVLLITDGYQMCYVWNSSTGTWVEDWSMEYEAIDAADRLLTKGIRTFVVGFGSGVDTWTLNQTAAAGGTAPAGCNPDSANPAATNNCYLHANSQAELVSALDQIAMRTTEEACDNKDNDCDGRTDNAFTGSAAPLSQTCSTSCGSGTKTCTRGAWGACSARTPSAETCNNVDDDCDGYLDNKLTGSAGALTKTCSTACGSGTQSCSAGAWGACSARTPSAETCNNVDDDCDGYKDNRTAGSSAPLTRACSSACGSGTQSCSAGAWGACSAPQPAAETCNNLDDDCDGYRDNRTTGSPGALTQTCTTACGAGTRTCSAGTWGSCSARAPTAETCNNVDDDCDGYLDNRTTGSPGAITKTCSTACGAGTQSCTAGAWSACSARQPVPETCNGVDDDCDGYVDNPTPGRSGSLSRACTSACGAGTQTCSGGAWGACSARQPAPETCNNADDDCDGVTDNVAGGSAPLSTVCSSACGSGVKLCRRGVWGACDAPPPGVETCDNVDQDCDGLTDNAATGRPGPLARSCSTACGDGTQTCERGLWSKCTAPPPYPEACNGADEDCDGFVDNQATGAAAPLTEDCSTICGSGGRTCAGGRWGACTAPAPAADTCNGRDDDCDGLADNQAGSAEPLSRPCVSACGTGKQTCGSGRWGACSARQPVPEVCGDGADNDCDGSADEGCECSPGQQRACASDVGECRPGSQTCGADGRWGDCQGARPPSAEVCDGLDNDCSGERDDGAECGAGSLCACGWCVPPCVNGACPNGGTCTAGFCVVDHCPTGTVCVDMVCVPGEGGPGTRNGPEVYAGAEPCGCGTSPAGAALPAVALLAAWRRRRAGRRA